MSTLAIDCLDAAFERTKSLLFPFDLDVWIRFTVIAAFAAGLGASNHDNIINALTDSKVHQGNVAIVGMIALIGLLIMMLIFKYFSSLANYMYVCAIVEGTKNISDRARKFAGLSLSLFFVNIALFVGLVITSFVGAILFFASGANLVLLILFIPAAIILIIAWSLMSWSINSFAVAVSYGTDKSILSSIGHMIEAIFKKPFEFTIFIIVYSSLGLIVGIIMGIAIFIVVFVLILGLLAVGLGPYIGVESIQGALTMHKMALVLMGVILLELVNFIMSFAAHLVFLPAILFMRVYSLTFWDLFDDKIHLFKIKEKSISAGEDLDSYYKKIKVY